MADVSPLPAAPHQPPPPPPPRPHRRKWVTRILLALFLLSVGINLVQWVTGSWNFTSSSSLVEQYVSGSKTAEQRIAIIQVQGTIMPPFTGRTLKAIKQAREDKTVVGVLLEIDSPGGFVADSHQILHRLIELRKEKPIVVSMQSMAASGGYYVAMGAGPTGKIFAEPTTWTGSIGVIIPRYELVGLKEKLGIDSKPLKTGEFKDALNPFEPLSDREKAVWDNILNQSFERFIDVIDEGRGSLNREQVRKLATGEVYTADDAFKHGLVDAIGYREDAIAHLQGELKISEAKVFVYASSPGLIDLILGARAPEPAAQLRGWLEATVPRAMFYCSWLPGLPRLPGDPQ